ncbi:MAG: hypothetical protein ACREH8_00210 [Opitutaceae bacterium]
MIDRLSELVRQRALVLEHLAWLDREIARATAAEAASPAAPATPTTPPPKRNVAPVVQDIAVPVTELTATIPAPGSGTSATKSPPLTPPPAEDMLEKFRVSPTAVHQDVRKGCLLYFVGAFVLLGIVVAILYFTISSR